jgi:hypothetical protein
MGTTNNELLWAIARDTGTPGLFREHARTGGFRLSFNANTNSLGTLETVGSGRHDSYVTHGSLAIVAFMVLFPVAVAAAAFRGGFRGKKGLTSMPLWMDVHRAAALLAPVMGIASVAYIVAKNKDAGVETWKDTTFNTHKVLGWLVALLGCMNTIGGLVRPDKGAGWRNIWFQMHRASGLLVLLIGIIQCGLGLKVMKNVDDSIKGLLIGTIVSGAAVVVFAIALIFLKPKHVAEPEMKKATTDI